MQRIKDMRILYKLSISFGVILVFLVFVGMISWTGINSVNKSVSDLMEIHIPIVELINETDVLFAEQELAVKRYGMHKEQTYLSDFEEINEQIRENSSKITGILRSDPDLMKKNWEVSVKKIFDDHDIFVAIGRKLIAGYKADVPMSELDEDEDSLIKHFNNCMQNIDGFLEKNAAEMQAVAKDSSSMSSRTSMDVLIFSILSIVLGVVLTITLTRGINVPLNAAVRFSEKIASGDFRTSLEIAQEDEIGILARALNRMKEELSQLTNQIQEGVNTLASSSTELSAISDQLSQSSEETAHQTKAVSHSVRDMSGNISSVAAASEQATTNLNIVASASEEMASTVRELAKNTSKANEMTTEAVKQAGLTSQKMNELGNAASEISKVNEVIAEISEQTNLLALNATIEAARAGDAGKGFAVVANEIKDLAKQTAGATMEIKIKIDGIQSSTALTVNEMRQISEIINQVNDIISNISSGVEQQAVTSSEIAENITQTSNGLMEINEQIVNNASAADEIAKNIAEVDQASSEIASGSGHIYTSSSELSKLAESLSSLVAKFKVA